MNVENPVDKKNSPGQEIPPQNNLPEMFRSLGRERYRNYIERLKTIVKTIHQYSPEYIFLTDTMAVIPGYAIKECWKVAYPKEVTPIFYRVNPKYIASILETCRILSGKEKSIIDGMAYGHNRARYMKKEAMEAARTVLNSEEGAQNFEREKKEIENFFRSRIKNKAAKVFVYDEETVSGKSPGTILELLSNPEKYGFSPDLKVDNIKMNGPGSSTVEESFFGLNPTFPYDLNREQILDENLDFNDFLPSDYARPVVKDNSSKDTIRGRINRDREKDTTPLETIKYLKVFGKKAGEELRAELEKSEA